MISYRHWAGAVCVPVLLVAVGCGVESGDVESEPGAISAALVPSLEERTRAAVVKERSFDGLDDRVTIPHRLAFNLGAGNFTMETWVKLAPGNTDYVPLLSKRLYHGDGFLFAYYGGKLLLQMNGVNLFSEAVSETSLRNGQYHHLSVTRQGTLISFFVDGQLRGTAQSGRGIVSTAPLLIGRDNENPQSLKGAVGDVRLWNTAKPNSYIAAAAQLSYNVTDEAGLLGWWNPNLTEKQVVSDLSVARAPGFLGTVASSTDAQDPKASVRPPVVIDLTPPAQLRLEDQCSDILVDGTVEPLIINSSNTVSADVKNYFCKSGMENLKKSLTLNSKLSLPIKGIPVALESDKNYTSDWAKAEAFCASTSETLTREEAYSWVGTTVNTQVVSAWATCMGTLNSAQVLIGSAAASSNNAQVTLNLRKQVLLPEQRATIINAIRFDGGVCTGALQVGAEVSVVNMASTCTRDPSDELIATVSTNHGVFVYNVPAARRGTAYATGAIEKTTVYTGTKQGDLSVGSRTCLFNSCAGTFLDGVMYPDPGFQFTNCWWTDLANHGNVSEARCDWNGAAAAYHIKRNGKHSAHFRFYASQSKTERRLEEFNSPTVSFVQGQNFVVSAPSEVVGNRVLIVTLNDGSSYAQNLEGGPQAPFTVVNKTSTGLRNFYNVTMP